jgi:hypothetical protein
LTTAPARLSYATSPRHAAGYNAKQAKPSHGQAGNGGSGNGGSSGGAGGSSGAASQKKPAEDISAAFGLGWHIAELKYTPFRTSSTGEGPVPQDKPGATTSKPENQLFSQITDLTPIQHAKFLLEEINSDAGRIARSSGTTLDLPVGIKTPLATSRSTESTLQPSDLNRMDEAHQSLLKGLFLQDYRLGKAYAIGAALGEVVLKGKALLAVEPPPAASDGAKTPVGAGKDDAKEQPNDLMVLFGKDRVSTIVSQLKDLKTEFEDHASDIVSATLQDWSETVGDWSKYTRETRKAAADSLDQQGTAWRAVLSGEKEATDYLRLTDYARAVTDLLGEYAGLARSVGLNGTTLVVLGVMLVLVAAGAGALYLLLSKQVEAIYTALIGLLAALGITGASITASIRSALSTAENQLWETELSAATAESIDFVPVRKPDSNVAGLRGQAPRPRISVLRPSGDQKVHERPIELGKWFGLSLLGGVAVIAAWTVLQVQGGVKLIDAVSVSASMVACLAVSLLAIIAIINWLAWFRKPRVYVWVLPDDIPRFRTDWLVPIAVGVGVVVGKVVWQ